MLTFSAFLSPFLFFAAFLLLLLMLLLCGGGGDGGFAAVRFATRLGVARRLKPSSG
jgi:hypothetical protein